ncbi:unnamed protein product [Microthlaspi erraticum]|uniref:Uncharacterized protein n=1 Tax=Microthlaspi erraticum TaxID=1685480 RepID=A0A6D2IJR5_9BRAS|nr:unnamed protein product [Microthlaspi erraticum]
MAPKKKPQTKQSNKPVASSSSIPNSNHKKPSKVPKLLISPEDEDHLRRLLLKFRRTVYPARAPLRSALYVAQKKKKLIDLYEKLSCEAFSNDHIDSALSSLRLTIAVAGGSVSVISTSRKDRNECPESPTTGEDLSESAESSNIPTTGEGLVPVKGKRDEEETLGSCQSSQPDWIRVSESLLESEFQREQSLEDDTEEEEETSSMPDGVHESVTVDALSIQMLDDLNLDANLFKRCSPKEIQPKDLPLSP